MGDFLLGYLELENIALFAGIIAGGIAILLIQIFTVKGRVKKMDKKRVDEGMSPLTDEEKEMVTKARRSETVESVLIYMFAMIIGIGVLYFF